jgi:murein DD-endopeptidase MepM/ murein hydrolase activator NlpD
VVRAGDTLTRIARRHHVDVEDIRVANDLQSEAVREGESLWIPRRGQSGAEVRASTRTGNPTPEPVALPIEVADLTAYNTRARELQLGGAHAGNRALTGQIDPRWIEIAGSSDGLDGTLTMPVDGGYFMRGWGSGLEGYHLATDIGAPGGTDVHASERGLVVYASDGMRGYGNFIIIVHPNGWTTGYAHNRQNLVVPGQVVERGQLIGHVGQTGFARGTHVHFVFAYEGEHCDPVPLFRPHIARVTGQTVDEPELVWDAEHRPSGIRCLPRSDRPNPNYDDRGRRRRRRSR